MRVRRELGTTHSTKLLELICRVLATICSRPKRSLSALSSNNLVICSLNIHFSWRDMVLNVFTFKLGTGSERFTVLVYKSFRLCSTFLITANKIPCNILSKYYASGKVNKRLHYFLGQKGCSLNQRKNSQLAYLRLLNNASLSSFPAASLLCYVVTFCQNHTPFSEL